MRAAVNILIGQALLAALLILPAAGQSAQDYSDLAYESFISGDYEQAVANYDRAIILQPNNTFLWNNKGRALAMLGRYEDAISSFDRSIAINTSDPESLCLKAIALSQGQKMHAQSTLLFDRVLQMNSSYFDAWIGKGMALANMGDLSGALQCFENAARIRPGDPSAWNNKGVVLMSMERYQEALDCFNQALSIKPLYEEALQNRETTLQAMNQASTTGSGRSVYQI